MAKDPFRYFRPEARDLCEQLGRGTLELERTGGGTPTDVARMLRLAHTLKGAARVVRQTAIADAAHAIEDALASARDGGAVERPEIASIREQLGAIMRALDAIDAPRDHTAPGPVDAAKRAEIAPVPSIRTDLADLDLLLDGLAECRIAVDSIHRVLDEGRVEPDAERVLRRYADQLARELRQIRESGEHLRLTSAAALFEPLDRVAQDAARTLGRRVVFEGRSTDLGLDAGVLDRLLPALVQLVRNAVAHGIEPPAGRAAAGKPAEGRIVLTVQRRGRCAAFVMEDDGRGVDLAAVRAALSRRPGGLRLTNDSSSELLDLLMHGGVSTAASVDHVSGRGVGLDIVRDTVARLGGASQMTTSAGAGTTVEVTVPLILAAVEVLVVEADGVTATVPVDAIRGTMRIEPSRLSETNDGLAIAHDGRTLPFLPLTEALRGRATSRPRPWTAVVVEANTTRAAIGVDRLLGTKSVILRPLPDLAPADPVVGGASQDDAGVPVLSLDPSGLIAAAHRPRRGASSTAAVRDPILVVDDSLTTRMLEQSILEAAGWIVDLAASGEEGLVAARARPHSLFLVDVEMPGIDGFTFVERVRADPTLAHVPAVLVTSRSAPEDRRRGHDIGAQGYIVKSDFDQRELCALIERLVRP